jgi:hypothetical protein
LVFLSAGFCAVFIAAGEQPPPAADEILELKGKIDKLTRALEDEKKKRDEEVGALRRKMETLERGSPVLSSLPPSPPAEAAAGRQGRNFQSFNPEVSAILDLYYHADSCPEGIPEVREELAGFGHSHGGEEHHHHGPDKGFNLRHAEFQFSAEVDPYFKASTIAAVSQEGAELETAEIETTCLPWGLGLKGGKFFSDFGRINAQHSHQWDFVDQPLIYSLTLGGHGLNEKGLQLSWLAPTPFYWLLGAEVFQGENEVMFSSVGGERLPSRIGPRLGVGWMKFGPELPGRHGLQFGFSGGIGRHQEAHDGDADGVNDHWLDGSSRFLGADFVYKYDDTRAYGQGDVILQGEYFFRKKDLELLAHDLAPGLVGKHKLENQDGYYLQATYGFLPRWRTGLRWEQVGLTNTTDLPDGSSLSPGGSWRLGAMLDFTPSEFSRLRLQLNHGDYRLNSGGVKPVTEFMLQWTISLGAHGAHKF